MSYDELTKAEELAIELLKKAAIHWPKSLWLFAADGKLYIMRKESGQHAMTRFGGGVNQAFILDAIDIETAGGDW